MNSADDQLGLSLIEQFKLDLTAAHATIFSLQKELHEKNQLIDKLNSIIVQQHEKISNGLGG